jgi:hypothetical protein
MAELITMKVRTADPLSPSQSAQTLTATLHVGARHLVPMLLLLLLPVQDEALSLMYLEIDMSNRPWCSEEENLLVTGST